MQTDAIKRILEGALLAAGRPLSLNDLEGLFTGDADAPPRDAIRAALAELADDWQARSLALQEVASGYRAQIRQEFEPWLARLWDEKPPRYSRALLETLAIIAYRQPITRSEIEDIRGVSVSTQIVRTLTEREWIRVVGQRDAPGRPAMYGTTRQFLDHFNLKTLDQLPELSELSEASAQHPELEFEGQPAGSGGEASENGSAGSAAAAEAAGGGGASADAEAASSDSQADDEAATAGESAEAGLRVPEVERAEPQDEAQSPANSAGDFVDAGAEAGQPPRGEGNAAAAGDGASPDDQPADAPPGEDEQAQDEESRDEESRDEESRDEESRDEESIPGDAGDGSCMRVS